MASDYKGIFCVYALRFYVYALSLSMQYFHLSLGPTMRQPNIKSIRKIPKIGCALWIEKY